MRIAYNPKSVEPLKVAPTGDYLNAITFDLAGHNIYTRGEIFKGTYRPIKVDNTEVLSELDFNTSLNLVAGNSIRLNAKTDSSGNYTGEVEVATTFQISGDFSGELADAFTQVKVSASTLKASENKTLTLNAGTGITLTPNTTSNTIQIGAPIFTGATKSAAGKEGIVPAPTKSNTISYLRGDGKWTDLTTDQIIELSGYSYNYKLTNTPSDLITTDTLNEALAKLEHKANQGVYAYNWVISVTTEDNDQYLNKWQEIVDFLNEIDDTDGADITDEFVTRKTEQTITGAKTFSAPTIMSNTLTVAGATAINNSLTMGGNVVPKTTNTYTLGTSSLLWKDIYSGLGTFSDNVTAKGFIKTNSSDSYVLTGGGGHKAISDFLLKEEELTNNVTEIKKDLTVTQDWMDTGIRGTDLSTGTYIVQVHVNAGNGTDQMYQCYSSGVMSWYGSRTNDTEVDEIILHRSGHAYEKTIYLRTVMQMDAILKLQICASSDISEAYVYTFKFKRII